MASHFVLRLDALEHVSRPRILFDSRELALPMTISAIMAHEQKQRRRHFERDEVVGYQQPPHGSEVTHH